TDDVRHPGQYRAQAAKKGSVHLTSSPGILTLLGSERSSPLGLLASESHAGTRCACDQAPLVVGDIALDQSHGATLFDHAADSEQPRLPNWLQEVDLELERREGFPFVKIR